MKEPVEKLPRRLSSPARRWETGVALLRVAVGSVFLIGGLKLVAPTLFGIAGRDALGVSFTDPTKGFVAPWLAERITDDVGVSISAFLLVQGVVEVTLGLLLVAGLGTRMVALNMAMMFWAFTVAAPQAGAVRLSRDLALLAVCVALFLTGGGRWSLDGLRRRRVAPPAGRRDVALVLIRLGMAYPLLASAMFRGGIFDNPLNTTLPVLLVVLIGLVLAVGMVPRWVMAPVALWLIYLLPAKLAEHGLFPGLDTIKREIGLLAAAGVYVLAGPDRWSWPRPRRLRCRQVTELLLAYVDGSLDGPQRRAVEEHIADCPDCWRFLGTYQQTVAFGQELRDDAMPVEVYERFEVLVREGLPNSHT